MPEKSDSAQGPLTGLRIIEMGQLLAGPFVGSRLADFGAEVIKVEQGGAGDPMREWGHHRYNGRPLWWPILARNKKSVTANLKAEAGQDLVRRLVAKADGLVENFKPGTLEKWGLGPDVLHEINPRLVICRVSGFGQTGPYASRPGFASVGEAMGGIRYINGFPDQPPPRAGISLGDTLTGMFAVQGMMMALYWRDALGGGKGQVIDAAITESCFAMLESALPEFQLLDVVRKPSGTGLANVSPSNIYPTADGKWIVIAANLDTLFRRLAEAMSMPELADDKRFSTHKARGEHAAELDGIIADWTKTVDMAALSDLMEEHGIVYGPIYSIADIADDPQFNDREMILRVPDPFFGEIAVPGIVPKLTKTPSGVNWLGPPKPGTHNREVYVDLLGVSEQEFESLGADGII